MKVLSAKECHKVSAGDISTDPLLVGVGIVGIIFFIYGFAPSAFTLAAVV